MPEAKLKLEMGSQPSICEQHSVGEVVAGYLADGAVRSGWLAANPCPQATKPTVTTRQIEPPTPEQVRAIVAEVAEVNEDVAVCLRLAAATGARRGELVALTWSDFLGERLTIRRAVVESDGALIERRTKTGCKGHRTVAVDADTFLAIDELRER